MKYNERYTNRYKELNKRLDYYAMQMEQIFEVYNEEAARIALLTEYSYTSSSPFRFSDYPVTTEAIERVTDGFARDTFSYITTNINEEWIASEAMQDLLAKGVFDAHSAIVSGQQITHMLPHDSEAMNAFIKRTRNGRSLSSNVWNLTKSYKQGLEAAISTAIQNGTSAVTLSKQVSKYLADYDSLKKDYAEKFGKAASIDDCEYRAARLARTEINMAYRNAENNRWQNMDYVLGYRVVLSNNHNCKGVPVGHFNDICDELQGIYPKDFPFEGWHPNCRCHTEPILIPEDDMIDWLTSDDDTRKAITDQQRIKDMPDRFYAWIEKNQDRIDKAKERGTMPYFMLDYYDMKKRRPQ